MPDTSTLLSLPYISPSQAQKHVTHNEAVRLLDVIVQLAVLARNLTAPPPMPAAGDRYIVAVAATGVWSGMAHKIALYDDGIWQFFAPNAGWTAWITDEQTLAAYDGAAWVLAAGAPQAFAQLGISATADAINRLTVSAPATLLNHAGAGHQLKLNKATAADTASLLFQTGFSGRAEMGAMGDDNFAIKVSADGSTFFTGLTIAGGDGGVTLPAALRLGGQPVDPAAPPNGTLWLNTATGEVKMRSNGATVVVAPPTGVSDGDKGDIAVAGDIWTLNAGAVGNAKLADMASATFKGRSSAGLGAPEDITAAQAAALLPVMTGAAKGLAPASGGGTVNFLRADATWAAPPAPSLGSLGITATAAQVNAGVLMPRVNVFDNPLFSINQRAVTGTVSLATGAYGHDRIKAVGATTYTFAAANGFTTITVTAGAISQVIDGANLRSAPYVLSWSGTATATIKSAAGTVLSTGSSPQSVSVTGGANLIVEFGIGTVSLVQLELGNIPTPFACAMRAEELLVCMEYFENGPEPEIYRAGLNATALYETVGFKVRKRAVPTVTTTGWQTYIGAAVATTQAPTMRAIKVDRFSFSHTAASITGLAGTGTWAASADL